MDGSKVRIAVSGTGGGAGQSILKALQNTDYEVVALDGEPLGTGLYTTKKSYLIPYSNHSDFIPTLLAICQKENIKLYFPGLDAELPILSANADKFTAIGTTVVVSSKDVVAIGDNKMETFTKLSKLGFNVPQTIDMAANTIDDLSFGYPFILKQREGGARSQNLYLIKTKEELSGLLDKGLELNQFIAQEYIEGDEYTCGSVNLDGQCKGVIVMRRILRDGDTYKCFPIRNNLIENEVKNIMNAIKPFGACNAQLRVRDGKVYVFEINARCSGTTGARALSGFNEPKMIADYLCHNIKPSYEIREQTILRYWKELVVPNELVEKMKKNKSIENESMQQL